MASSAALPRWLKIFFAAILLACLMFACQCQNRPKERTQDSYVNVLGSKPIGSYPSRVEMLNTLEREQFDVLIIGGGATGAGAALDAAARGLKTALVEAHDFSFATSSRSTKLVHGGVRYLEKAVKNVDFSEYALVRDALRERKQFLQNAPHLTNPIPIITPVYGWFEALYYLIGLKMYDMIAGAASLGQSQFITRESAVTQFPILKKDGLKGAVVYYDGQFNDARMNITLILSAIREGAVAVNYVRATDLIKENGVIKGAYIQDRESQKRFPILAKVVINATGAFADSIRRMDDKAAPSIMKPSQGSHILLAQKFSSPSHGLIIPKTKDGRVIFLLPWLGKTLCGTTDIAHELTEHPIATEQEVRYILEHVRHYFDVPVTRRDVLATWSGLRPLAKPSSQDLSTAQISRDHLIEISAQQLVTIVGGKWTTYRKMAEEVIDTAISVGELRSAGPCVTKDLKLVGALYYKENLAGELMTYESLEPDIARHLADSYGDRVDTVIDMKNKSQRARLVDGLPNILAEVAYAVEHEYALHATDVIARRTRIAFLDNHAARAAVPQIIAVMAEKLSWSPQRIEQERRSCEAFLDSMLTVPVTD